MPLCLHGIHVLLHRVPCQLDYSVENSGWYLDFTHNCRLNLNNLPEFWSICLPFTRSIQILPRVAILFGEHPVRVEQVYCVRSIASSFAVVNFVVSSVSHSLADAFVATSEFMLFSKYRRINENEMNSLAFDARKFRCVDGLNRINCSVLHQHHLYLSRQFIEFADLIYCKLSPIKVQA